MSGQEAPQFRDLRNPEVRRGEWGFWDWVATYRPGFKTAFETLVSEGCDGWALLDLLDRIQHLAANPGTTASPDDVRAVRRSLETGADALSGLVDEPDWFGLTEPRGPAAIYREEWRLLSYSQEDAKAALRMLKDLASQLRTLQRGAHRRRRRFYDQYRAMLVRYVKRTTGRLHDESVCNLLEPAASGWPDLHYYDDGVCDPEEIEVEVDPDHPWEEITVDAHRRWRGRNKPLIDDPSELETLWEREMRQKREPKPQRLPWPLQLRGSKSA